MLLSSPLSLQLRYELDTGSVPPPFCNGHTPAVTVTFICPSARQEVKHARTHIDTEQGAPKNMDTYSVDELAIIIYHLEHLPCPRTVQVIILLDVVPNIIAPNALIKQQQYCVSELY